MYIFLSLNKFNSQLNSTNSDVFKSKKAVKETMIRNTTSDVRQKFLLTKIKKIYILISIINISFMQYSLNFRHADKHDNAGRLCRKWNAVTPHPSQERTSRLHGNRAIRFSPTLVSTFAAVSVLVLVP